MAEIISLTEYLERASNKLSSYDYEKAKGVCLSTYWILRDYGLVKQWDLERLEGYIEYLWGSQLDYPWIDALALDEPFGAMLFSILPLIFVFYDPQMDDASLKELNGKLIMISLNYDVELVFFHENQKFSIDPDVFEQVFKLPWPTRENCEENGETYYTEDYYTNHNEFLFADFQGIVT